MGTTTHLFDHFFKYKQTHTNYCYLCYTHIIRHICKFLLEMFPSFTSFYQICQLLYLSTFITVDDPELQKHLCAKDTFLSFFSFSHFLNSMLFLLQQTSNSTAETNFTRQNKHWGNHTLKCAFFLSNRDLSFDHAFWGFFTYIFLAFHCKNSTHSQLQAAESLCFTLYMLFRALTFIV